MISALRALLATLLGLLQSRLAMFAADWAAELLRCARLVYWLGLSLFFLVLGTSLLVAGVLMAFWEQRVLATLLMSLLAFGLWRLALWQWQTVSLRPRGPWEATLDQMRRDREAL